MKKLPLVIILTVAILCGIAAGPSPATHAIPNSSLSNVDSVRAWLRANNPGFQVYTNGNNVLYRPNGNSASGWILNANPTYSAARNNTGDSRLRNNCTDLEDNGFRFSAVIRSNNSDYNCGTTGDHTEMGGRITFTAQTNEPSAIFVRDVDSNARDYQRVLFTRTRVMNRYLPDTNRKLRNAGSSTAANVGFINNGAAADTHDGTGHCDNHSVPWTDLQKAMCSGLVLLTGTYNITILMYSNRGGMRVSNTVPMYYSTLIFNPNGGSVSERSPAPNFPVIRSYYNPPMLRRDYARNETANSFPVPTRAGYIFAGWCDTAAATGGTCYSSMVMTANRTLYARWAPDIAWSVQPTAAITSPASYNSSSVTDVQAHTPGNTLTWTHSIRNNGPNPTDRVVQYRALRLNSGGTYETFTGAPWWQQASGFANGATTSTPSSHIIQQSDVGNQVCRLTRAEPSAYAVTGTPSLDSSPACRTIPHYYALTPVITTPGSNSIVSSDDVDIAVVGRVVNGRPDGSPSSSTGTKSRPGIEWRITQVEYAPGVNPPTVQMTSGSYPTTPAGCSAQFGTATCQILGQGTEVDGYGYNGSETYSAIGHRSSSMPIGTKVCFIMSVSLYSWDQDGWIHNPPTCIVIGKQPKVQVHGSGIQVGRTFNGSINTGASVETSLTRKSGPAPSTYLALGSWSEYGIFAPSSINLIASGAGLNVPTGHTSANQDAWSAYSFTKRSGTNNYGAYNYNNPSLPDVTTVFSRGNAQQVALSSDPNRHYDVTAIASNPAQNNRSIRPRDADAGTTNITVGASNPTQSLATSQWLVINAQRHNVTITSNIVYANGPFSTTDQIPQLVIIADNITIADTVSRVDAWLIAKNDSTRPTAHGAIATCNQQAGGATSAQWLAATSGPTTTNYESSSADLTVAHCTTPLQINGPVIANKLFLRRTAGSGTLTTAPNRPGDPAETINLRPDAYLWARTQMSPGLVYQVTTERELPPRY